VPEPRNSRTGNAQTIRWPSGDPRAQSPARSSQLPSPLGQLGMESMDRCQADAEEQMERHFLCAMARPHPTASPSAFNFF